MSDVDAQRAYVKTLIAQGLKRYAAGCRKWVMLSDGSTIGIVLASAIAGLLTQVDIGLGHRAKDIASVLSLTVTVITILQYKIGYERRLHADRLRQIEFRNLEIDEEMGADLQYLVDAIKASRVRHFDFLSKR